MRNYLYRKMGWKKLDEKINGLGQAINQTVNFRNCIVDVETGTVGCRNTETLHNGLGTVVAGSNGNSPSV